MTGGSGRTVFKLDANELPFRVVEWDKEKDTPYRTISASAGISIAIGAYEAALAAGYATKYLSVLLMQGARVIRDSAKSEAPMPKLALPQS